MKILVINAGSSSLKYQLIDMDDESVLAKGNCERIGMEDGIFTHKTNDGREKHVTVSMPDHTAAFTQVKNALIDPEVGVLKSLDEVSAVGHRIVQGGALFSKSVLVDDKVIEGIESLIPLAPLHNKAHVQGIRACIEVFGKSVPEVVVFDTAFHSTMPPKAYMYPIPYEYYEKYAVRRYGFHGTSHRYVSHRCAELMGQDLKDQDDYLPFGQRFLHFGNPGWKGDRHQYGTDSLGRFHDGQPHRYPGSLCGNLCHGKGKYYASRYERDAE